MSVSDTLLKEDSCSLFFEVKYNNYFEGLFKEPVVKSLMHTPPSEIGSSGLASNQFTTGTDPVSKYDLHR